MNTSNHPKNTILKSLKDLQTNHLFPKFEDITADIACLLKCGEINQQDVFEINRSFSEDFLDNTIQGHGLKKPFGYAGDYLMIDKIYTCHTSGIQPFKKWDEFFHLQSAPKAVRNRKAYFKMVIKSKLQGKKDMDFLNIASGPARDLAELYAEINHPMRLNSTCVEMDKNAVEYAKRLTKAYSRNINYINKNIFKFNTNEKFDLIWSAGLFDYLEDKAFIILLKKMKNWCKENGEIVIGNFNHDHNPSRNYMEIFGEWFLIHRTEAQLLELGKKAGFNKNQMFVGREPENVNLFLHIK